VLRLLSRLTAVVRATWDLDRIFARSDRRIGERAAAVIGEGQELQIRARAREGTGMAVLCEKAHTMHETRGRGAGSG